MRELRVAANGATLSVVDYGGAGPAVICLHGFGLNAASWETVAAVLEGEYRVLAIDQRGHGLTGPASEYTQSALIEDVRHVASSLDSGPPLVVGHSYGARTALGYAAAGTCAGVVAVDGAITPPGPDSDLAALERELNSSALSDFLGSPAELDALLVGLDDQFPDYADGLRRVIHRRFAMANGILQPVMTVADTLEVARATEVRQPLRALYEAVGCPVLLVLASHDDRAQKEAALRGLPLDDDAVRWIDCGHLVPIEAPAQLAAVIHEFARAIFRRDASDPER